MKPVQVIEKQIIPNVGFITSVRLGFSELHQNERASLRNK